MSRFLLVAVFVLGMVIGMMMVSVQAQGDEWQFEADRQVEVRQARDTGSALVRVISPNEIVTVRGPYVWADDLVWVEMPGVGFAAVARYGVCEIRSFGSWIPGDRAPVSVGD